MSEYTPEERDQIVRDYFGPAGADAPPRCPNCGETLLFTRLDRAEKFTVRISCSECQSSFEWKKGRDQEAWKPLHLEYFLERFRSGNKLRCPFDDCYVLCTEFSDGILEFRCPYCNRRGQTQLPNDLVVLE